MEDILHVFFIHAHQRIVVAVEVFPQERISLWSSKWEQRTVDQLIDLAVPQVEEEVLARIVSQEHPCERFLEQIDDFLDPLMWERSWRWCALFFHNSLFGVDIFGRRKLRLLPVRCCCLPSPR